MSRKVKILLAVADEDEIESVLAVVPKDGAVKAIIAIRKRLYGEVSASIISNGNQVVYGLAPTEPQRTPEFIQIKMEWPLQSHMHTVNSGRVGGGEIVGGVPLEQLGEVTVDRAACGTEKADRSLLDFPDRIGLIAIPTLLGAEPPAKIEAVIRVLLHNAKCLLH